MVEQQVLCFLYSVALGGVFGIIYDIFRCLRVSFKNGTAAVCAEDIICFIIFAFLTFSFMLQYTDGKIRLYVILGEIIGGIGYLKTVGTVTVKLFRVLSGIIKKILRVIFYPFKLIFKSVLKHGKK